MIDNDFISECPFIKYISYCQKELVNHYRDPDIFVMSSKYGTFGLVYAEAMSQGLPVIYIRGQGFDGQVNEGEVGYSVQYDSAEEIAKRIEDILDNYENISN
ncbi:glycosyltransferase [Schnuerera sp. xch1]|uniref:glycosyltransferase n=1 Tax=Schnuerera sp. xch1 TaxID=2874283 RepID=UPI001CBF964B|nr:glycosyltransferase [Schnuerera sp. xch1]MBZ2174079.1 glycosyltransferase [Schnuerera sp. xch1]